VIDRYRLQRFRSRKIRYRLQSRNRFTLQMSKVWCIIITKWADTYDKLCLQKRVRIYDIQQLQGKWYIWFNKFRSDNKRAFNFKCRWFIRKKTGNIQQLGHKIQSIITQHIQSTINKKWEKQIVQTQMECELTRQTAIKTFIDTYKPSIKNYQEETVLTKQQDR